MLGACLNCKENFSCGIFFLKNAESFPHNSNIHFFRHIRTQIHGKNSFWKVGLWVALRAWLFPLKIFLLPSLNKGPTESSTVCRCKPVILRSTVVFSVCCRSPLYSLSAAASSFWYFAFPLFLTLVSLLFSLLGLFGCILHRCCHCGHHLWHCQHHRHHHCSLPLCFPHFRKP